MPTNARSTAVLTAILLFTLTLAAHVPCAASGVGQTISDATAPVLLTGELLLLTDKNAGKAQAVQGAKALITNEVLTEGLKYVVREKRPNSDSKTSFPSGHTSAAFTMATVITGYHPKYGWLAYGTAAAIGWSRVDVRAHHWWDVVAGAGLGCVVGSHYTHQHLTAGPGGMKVNWRF